MRGLFVWFDSTWPKYFYCVQCTLSCRWNLSCGVGAVAKLQANALNNKTRLQIKSNALHTSYLNGKVYRDIHWTKKTFSIPDEITKMRLFEICLWVWEPVKGEKIASTPPKQLWLMRRFSDTTVSLIRTLLLVLFFTISSLSLFRSLGFTNIIMIEIARPHPPIVILRHLHDHIKVRDAFSSSPASGESVLVEESILQTWLGHYQLVQFVLTGLWGRSRAILLQGLGQNTQLVGRDIQGFADKSNV